MMNDPYVTLDLHRARVEALTADAKADRLARLLRRHASSTAATDDLVPAPRRALHRRTA